MAIKIFISHSRTDEDLAKALVAFVQGTLRVPDDEIRCTTLAPYALPPAAEFTGVLQRELHEADVVIGLLTQASIRRSWVLFELGHAWGNKKSVAVVASDVSDEDIPGPLAYQKAVHAENLDEMLQLVDRIQVACNLKNPTPASMRAQIERFRLSLVGARKRLQSEPYWTHGRIVTGRHRIFRQAADELLSPTRSVHNVMIYAPTGVWESDYPEKQRWFQMLAKCLANHHNDKLDWIHEAAVDRDVRTVESTVRELQAVFGLPPHDIEGLSDRVEEMASALRYFHGVKTARLFYMEIDTPAVRGLGFVRIDNLVASAWASTGSYGVDTALLASDSRISKPVDDWFGKSVAPFLAKSEAIQFMEEKSRGLCTQKGMNQIREYYGLRAVPVTCSH
jgi:hypothetical protein